MTDLDLDNILAHTNTSDLIKLMVDRDVAQAFIKSHFEFYATAPSVDHVVEMAAIEIDERIPRRRGL